MIGLPIQTQPPAADEIEFSLFGSGYGECIVLHLGRGDWVVVDSCKDAAEDIPVALAYLKRIGVDPEKSVRLVVATHWHDDHICGISKVLDSAKNAALSISGAFQDSDFRLALGPWLANATSVDGKGVGEIDKLISITKKHSSHVIPASENKVLFERHDGDPVQVRALSPSDPAVISCIAQLKGIDRGHYCRRLPKIEGNHASVVLSVQVGTRRILLGGDLECRADRKFGWLAIVDLQNGSAAPKHHLFKIPHHGSSNGHHEEIWSSLLHPNPYSALTPVVTGSTTLPKSSDRDRMLEFTNQAFLTTTPKPVKFRDQKDRAVEKTMQETARKLVVIPQSNGHICMRGSNDDTPSNWTVTCHGGAIPLQQMPD